ncbi:CARD- and ANK-domain containing inflammasome adapter protein-like [Dromiciops gliroides]|uniref:CARD- and ANK-domain containing inflammasome adapter protein-like n=1 Tax=Dromiciops gliroides TaxID=33562 RepID=UPI001CC68DE2|nr:CARD- and ANK-domain containing inflammasome adapter protein-like [Dromiciops gliroides]
MCSSTYGRSSPYATEVMKMKKRELAAGIKDSDVLIKRLVDYGIFTPEQKLALSYYKTHLEKVTRVLDILISQGEHACRMFFYPCLKQLEPDLYHVIRKYTMGTDEIIQGTGGQLVGHLLERDKDNLEKSVEQVSEKQSTGVLEASVKPKTTSYGASKIRKYPPTQTPGNSPIPPMYLLTASGKGDVADIENVLEDKHVNEILFPRESPLGMAVVDEPAEILNYPMTKGSRAEGKDGKEKSLLQRAAERARGDAAKVLQGGMGSNNLERDPKIPLSFNGPGGQPSLLRPMLEENLGKPHHSQHRSVLQEESQGAPVFPENEHLLDDVDKNEDSASDSTEINSLDEAIKILLTAGVNADSGIVHNAFHHDDRAVIQLLLKDSAALPPETREQALFEGVRKNLPEVVAALADGGTDLNVRNDRRYTPLLLAAEMDRTACAEILIQRGADLEAKTASLESALHLAVKTGAVYTAELLLDSGMSPNVGGWNGQTPLHVAAWHNKHEMVSLLIHAGAQINTLSTEQISPLHIACERGNLDTAAQLLQHEADANVKNKLSMTPLHLAARVGNRTMVELLLHSGADPNMPDKEKKTPLHWATSGGYLEVVKSLLIHKVRFGAKDMDGFSPLHYAALKGNMEMVKLFLEAGKSKNLNERNIYRKTPLHLAAEQGHGDLIKLLLSCGAAVNALDNNRDTPLHCACKTGHWNSVTSLVNCPPREKPDLQAANSLGKTPLQVAECTASENQEQIVSLLKKKMFLTR